jgi:ketosteroid isomerase-like protein
VTSANVELVRSIYAAWERGDYSHGEWAHPEIEIVLVLVGGPAPGSWKGLAATAEGFREWFSAWEGVSTRVDEYRTLDAERVLVFQGFGGGRGKRSGLELADMATEGANVFHVRDGKVTKLVTYWDRDRALADLGLEA